MKKNVIYKLISFYVLVVIIGFFGGYFITDLINKQNEIYVSSFTLKEGDYNANFDSLNDENFLREVINNHPNLSLESIDVTSLLNNHDFVLTTENDVYTITTKTRYYETSYIFSSNKVISRASTFIKYSLYDLVGKNNVTFLNSNIGEIKNSLSRPLGGLIGITSLSLIVTVIILVIPKKNINDFTFDNEETFKNPFSLAYWKKAFTELKSTKKIVTLGMLFSLVLLSKFISLPSGFANLNISLGFIFLAIIGYIYGPVVSFIIGASSDIIGYFINQSAYVFNLGYTLQAALACFVYGILFYKTRMTFSKVLLSRIIINFVLNVLMGSYLMIIVYYQGGTITSEQILASFRVYALVYSLPKNIICLLPQSILLYAIIKVISPILSRFNYISKEVSDNITLI